jgi:carbon monoxide dehydrogenase subunit G
VKIEGTQNLAAPAEQVYALLIDPEVLAHCIPGCESLEQTAENTFSATLKAGVGSIKGTFKGTVRLEDLRPNEHFRMVVEGKGAPGFLKGSGTLNLEEQNGTTTVSYDGNIQVGGTIASVGQRMILATAKMTANQFFTCLEAETKPTLESEPQSPPGFFRTTLSWISGWLREFFRKR